MDISNNKFFQTNHILLFVLLVFSLAIFVSCSEEVKQEAKETVSEVKESVEEVALETTEAVSEMTETVEEKAQEIMKSEPETVAEASSSEAETSNMEESTDGDKPYTVSADGKVDWYTFNGYRRYHSECHVCHGPAGLGSSFAPDLTKSVVTMGYEGYLETVVNGRQVVSNTATQNMPSFATNKNVMCYVDDIYAYLVARADGVVGRERPDKEAKPQEAMERDETCM